MVKCDFLRLGGGGNHCPISKNVCIVYMIGICYIFTVLKCYLFVLFRVGGNDGSDRSGDSGEYTDSTEHLPSSPDSTLGNSFIQ